GKYIETWVPTEMLAPPPQALQKAKTPTPQTETIIYVVATKQSHVREEPNIKSKSLRIVSPGTKMEKLDEQNNMFKVRLPSGLIGWIDKSLTQKVTD
ncbi:MAG: SH3 domain-containing protein, partial [Syntrophorhabdaceae bacterium]|nr:SH3 domain-containing protein [Syntrophorhabdaceae bacterium]